MGMGFIVVLVAVGLVISYAIADEFSAIAARKGSNDRKYFWFCFLFGIAGYLMVVALPVKNSERDIAVDEKNKNGGCFSGSRIF